MSVFRRPLQEGLVGLPFHCLSYSPLPTLLSTLNPAFFASEMERVRGELNDERSFLTGFLQAGHLVSGTAERGRRRTNLPPQTLQSPSQSSYSYKGIFWELWGNLAFHIQDNPPVYIVFQG